MKRKILVVEDSFVFAEELRLTLEMDGYEVTDVIVAYEELEISLKTNTPEFVLLDINLEGEKSGIDIANDLLNVWKIPFMFITAQTDTSTFQQAIKYYPTHYLTKPCNSEDVIMSIELAFHNLSLLQKEEIKKVTKVFTEYSKGVKQDVVVEIDDIIWFESRQNFVAFYMNDDDSHFLERSTIKQTIEEFGESFIQIHRNYGINLRKVSSCSPSEVCLTNGKRLPISRRQKQNLVNHLNQSDLEEDKE